MKKCTDFRKKQFTTIAFYAKIAGIENERKEIYRAQYQIRKEARARDREIKSALKTQIKKFMAAVEAGDKETANKLYPETVSAIDSACSKGLLHKNNAANKKAKLAKRLAAIA